MCWCVVKNLHTHTHTLSLSHLTPDNRFHCRLQQQCPAGDLAAELGANCKQEAAVQLYGDGVLYSIAYAEPILHCDRQIVDDYT